MTLDERASAALNDEPPDERPPALVRVEVGDLHAATLPSPGFVAYPIIPRGVVTLLGGHGGAGKSILALVIAAHVAAGRDWSEFPVESGRVLLVSLEDDADIIRWRLQKVVAAYGLDSDKVANGITILDGTGSGIPLADEYSDGGLRKVLPTRAMQELAEAAAGHALVIADNASDAYAANENDRQGVRKFVRMLQRVAADHDAGMMLLAHIDKSAARFGAAGNSYSGSTAWHNTCRSRLALLTDKGGPELRHEKWQWTRQAPALRLAWSEHGVLIPATSNTSEPSDQDKQDDVILLGAFDAAQRTGLDVPTARTGPATARHVLATLTELPQELGSRSGATRFWHAIGRLECAGSIRRERYQNAHRHQRERYVRT